VEPGVRKQVDKDNAYFTIQWSALRQTDRYEIIRIVPAVAGIYELYYRDAAKALRLFHVARAWYGGLRASIRETTDPELVRNGKHRAVLGEYETWYRYAPVRSYHDMSDLLFFFAETYFPNEQREKGSGRYDNVFVIEQSPDKLVDVD
jgi:hypothetical protein